MSAIDQARLQDDHLDDRADRELEDVFRAHTSPAFYNLVRQRVVDDPGNPLSLATCEKVPTSDAEKARNHPTEYEYLERITDAREAIQVSISRSRDRQEKILELIVQDEVAHAKRLALCRRQSVQLECPTMAGGCGSDENYIPVSCDSRLCPECSKRRMGKIVHQYRHEVSSWDHPTMLRLSLPKRIEPEADELERAVDALRGAFGRLRRRVIPADGPGWSWEDWRRSLNMVGRHDLARSWQKQYVEQDRGIPFDEVVRTGFYGIDLKQGDDGTINVHAHVLANVPWLPQAALSELWGELIDAPVVDIRRIDGRGEQDLESAVLEVVGYAAKPPDFHEVEDEVAYLKALKGSKLIQPFGELHGNTPELPRALECGECERSPAYWNYLGIVDGTIETMTIVGGSSSDGDGPPD